MRREVSLDVLSTHGPIDLGPAPANAGSARLRRPLRTEQEVREGRRAAAELDDRLGEHGPCEILLRASTAPGALRHEDRPVDWPGRFVITLMPATALVHGTRKPKLYLAQWQNAASGEILCPVAWRALAPALCDVAERLSAGRLEHRPGKPLRALPVVQAGADFFEAATEQDRRAPGDRYLCSWPGSVRDRFDVAGRRRARDWFRLVWCPAHSIDPRFEDAV